MRMKTGTKKWKKKEDWKRWWIGKLQARSKKLIKKFEETKALYNKSCTNLIEQSKKKDSEIGKCERTLCCVGRRQSVHTAFITFRKMDGYELV